MEDIKPKKPRRLITKSVASSEPELKPAISPTPSLKKISPIVKDNKPRINYSWVGTTIWVKSVSSRLKALILKNGINLFLGSLILTTSFFLYIFRLATTPQITLNDVSAFSAVNSISSITNNLLFAPQKIIDFALIKLDFSSVFSFRLVSAFFVILSIVLFFILIKRWLGLSVALFSSALYASSTWTIFNARDIGWVSLFLVAVPLLFLSGELIKSSTKIPWLYAIFLGLSLSMYLPGFIWLILIGLAINISNIKVTWLKTKLIHRLGLSAIFILPVIPLLYYIFQNTGVLSRLLGLPGGINIDFSTILNNFSSLPDQLFISGIDNPLFWLINTPLLDAATSVLFIAGLASLVANKNHPVRKIAILSTMIVCLILVSLNGYSYISILFPLIYILVGVGIAFLLKKWFSIFPKNPVARYIGTGMITLLILLISSYHITRYFVAWPRATATKQAFEGVKSDTINIEYKE